MAGFLKIEEDLLFSERFTLAEVVLLSKILSLSEKTGACFPKNKYLSKYTLITPKSCNNMINDLKNRGYLEIKYKEDDYGERRRYIYPTTLLIGILEVEPAKVINLGK